MSDIVRVVEGSRLKRPLNEPEKARLSSAEADSKRQEQMAKRRA